MEKRPLYGCIFTTRMSLSCIPKANNYHERAVCTVCSSFRARNRIHLTRLTTSPRHFLDNPIAHHRSLRQSDRTPSIASTIRSNTIDRFDNPIEHHRSLRQSDRTPSIASTIRSNTIDRFDNPIEHLLFNRRNTSRIQQSHHLFGCLFYEHVVRCRRCKSEDRDDSYGRFAANRR